MLTSLTFHQFALLAHHELTLVDGFNVITGETGAGKSLLLDALSLCIGERADSNLVRHGAKDADIYAQFDVSDNAAVTAWFAQHERSLDEPELLIRRQLSSGGRSKAWLNGSPVSLAELKTLGDLLVNIHSQHAQQALLKPQFVVDWLDIMAGTGTLAKQTKHAYQQHQQLKRQAGDIAAAAAQRQDRIQLLSNQLLDVEPLLSIDYDSIEAEHEELSNIEALMQEAAAATSLLDNDNDGPNVTNLLGRAIKLCEHQISMSPTFAQVIEQLYLAQEQINDASHALSDYAQQQLPDPERLQKLDKIISLAHRLSRKYNLPPASLSSEAKNWQQQLEELQNQPDTEAMTAKVEQAWQEYLHIAEQLSAARQQHATNISTQLVTQLQPLALPNVRCQFEFIRHPDASEFTAQGLDHIELMFSANVGMPMQPLYKVASGGELSRMALVMQVLQATQCNHTSSDSNSSVQPLLVFDEVDVGISGATAQVVGEMLRQLGDNQQLLAITHQAQVAAQAHQHILVQKRHDQQSESILHIIQDDAQIDELARMSGGVTITDVTRDHARSLLAAVGNE